MEEEDVSLDEISNQFHSYKAYKIEVVKMGFFDIYNR